MLNRAAKMVLLDYLCKAVRQAPARCIFPGDIKKNTCAGVATNMTTGNSCKGLFITLSNPH